MSDDNVIEWAGLLPGITDEAGRRIVSQELRPLIIGRDDVLVEKLARLLLAPSRSRSGTPTTSRLGG